MSDIRETTYLFQRLSVAEQHCNRAFSNVLLALQYMMMRTTFNLFLLVHACSVYLTFS